MIKVLYMVVSALHDQSNKCKTRLERRLVAITTHTCVPLYFFTIRFL